MARLSQNTNISQIKWFDKRNIDTQRSIVLNDLNGFVLPHAGTKYTGKIISDTIRFKPTKYFNTILIFYCPSNHTENIIFKKNKYFHEYYVVKKTMELALENWGITRPIRIVGINILTQDIKSVDIENTFFVISADFSHHLTLNDAISKENIAVNSIFFKNWNSRNTRVVDDIETFKLFNKIIMNNTDWNYHWVGRTRSPNNIRGVGYLSFLIRDRPYLENENIDGFFVTVYDKHMKQRECLGKFFNSDRDKDQWSESNEQQFINDTIQKAKTTSRLTGGRNLNVPVSNYTVTYLYKDNYRLKMIRGWHGVKYGAFFLPSVLLENTFDNGDWITPNDTIWPSDTDFNVSETISKLIDKYNQPGFSQKNPVLYKVKVRHEYITY